jgi:hypothetical protein
MATRQWLTLLLCRSTIARSFSAELMDIFRIENSVADLDEQVDKRSVAPPADHLSTLLVAHKNRSS